eukprot:CAMPEP_0178569378 /NCGR_PEP_ID=MMETSP0697-20121206/16456_1 /TAXON_ID=265572 /ORGANISM="Extubocellulus spinifer, Strain CCMP396" /LENGTH=37 /DNA_ID= /DNA_START= /DNA_END= /DNA_ORIENTATION=
MAVEEDDPDADGPEPEPAGSDPWVRAEAESMAKAAPA